MKVHLCESCGNAYMPKKGARRSKYCKPACNQKAYRERLKQTEKAHALTLTMEEAQAYNELKTHAPSVEHATTAHAKFFGNESALSLIRVLAQAWNELMTPTPKEG